MPTAKKLPSGSWRCQVFSHYEESLQKDGTIKKKRIYKSFTCDDQSKRGKKACEQMAAEWALHKGDTAGRCTDHRLTVRDAINEYIDIKRNVLSPSTIRNYRQYAKRYFDGINDLRIRDISTPAVQKWVNDLSVSLSPKSISNIYGLFTSVLYTFRPDVALRVKLPQKQIYQGYVPTDDDIRTLIRYTSANDPGLLTAIYLAAFGTMRRSEICGLDASDVDRQHHTIHVHRAMIMGPAGSWVVKDVPKTGSSDRYIEMPPDVIAQLPEDGRLVPYTPNRISIRFKLTLERAGLPHFRFHDLRHYAASIMHALGVPDVYIMQRGGWSSDQTLKRLYRGSMEDYARRFTLMTLEHQEELMQHDMQHEKEKPLKIQGL